MARDLRHRHPRAQRGAPTSRASPSRARAADRAARWRWVLVDDGSDDGTAAVARASSRPPRLDRSQPRARTAGERLAEGAARRDLLAFRRGLARAPVHAGRRRQGRRRHVVRAATTSRGCSRVRRRPAASGSRAAAATSWRTASGCGFAHRRHPRGASRAYRWACLARRHAARRAARAGTASTR